MAAGVVSSWRPPWFDTMMPLAMLDGQRGITG
jgi:hypothetical protein